VGRLREVLWALRSSFWLVPGVALALAVALAVMLVGIDARLEQDLAQRWPLLFGAGAEGARGILEAIAGSMITVAGVVFSVTVVALSLAASAYSPRILRTFMHDRGTQLVFGTLVGAFAYCLVVLRTVRSGGAEGPAFVPSLAVLGALALALLAVCMLVYFVHHLVTSIQVSTILSRVARETRRAIDGLFPEWLGEDEDDTEPEPVRLAWRAVAARRSGYIVAVDGRRLLDWAARRGVIVRMELAVGEFAVEALPLVSLAGGAPGDARGEAAAIDALYSIAEQRTIDQDAAFGLQQMVDVAVRALSPGVNDPTTARTCIHHLAALLARLARRRMPTRLRRKGGEPRLIVKAPDFESLVAMVFEPLARDARERPEVLATLAHAAWLVARASPPSRRAVMQRHLDALQGATRGTSPA
jgi:uncharacterized membrane protein